MPLFIAGVLPAGVCGCSIDHLDPVNAHNVMFTTLFSLDRNGRNEVTWQCHDDGTDRDPLLVGLREKSRSVVAWRHS